MERKQLLNKVANLTDNINKKVRAFREADLNKFYEIKLNKATAQFDKKISLTMESGYLTKSKKELDKLSTKELEKLFDNLKSLQTDKEYGTVKRFKATEKIKLDKTASRLRELLGDEKYNKLKGDKTDTELVKEFIKRKEELNGKRGSTYNSNQVINTMYLESGNLSQEEQQDTMRAIDIMSEAREQMSRNQVSREGRAKNGNR